MLEAPEIIITGALKKIFGALHSFGAILAVNMDKLPVMFSRQRKGTGLVINAFIVTALGRWRPR